MGKGMGLGGCRGDKVGSIQYPRITKTLSAEDGKKSFTLHVEPGDFTDGEVIGMIGENGTGKTTYMEILAGVHNKPILDGYVDGGTKMDSDSQAGKASWMCSTPGCQKPSWNKCPGEYCSRQCRAQQAMDCQTMSLLDMGVSMSFKKQNFAPKFRRY